ncbi:MAG: acylphosphatase [bacterium]
MRLHLWVSGRVQGVYFRESMRREAERMGVEGWVRNMPDGRVEAVVQGDAPLVQALATWCKRGPPAAEVTGVEAAPEPDAPLGDAGFHVRR